MRGWSFIGWCTDGWGCPACRYPGFFEGKDELKKHLYAIGEALPADFRFNIDELAVSSFDEVEGLSRIGVQWHVGLADGRKLPFTRGSSMYKVNGEGKITSGFDVPEPVLKTGDANLAILKWAGYLLDLDVVVDAHAS